MGTLRFVSCTGLTSLIFLRNLISGFLPLRPLEIEAQFYPQTFNFQKVLHLFAISHKYQFDSYETWALRMLNLHCKDSMGFGGVGSSNRILDDNNLCPTPKLELLLRLVVQSNDESLIPAIELALIRRLESHPTFSIAQTLALAEGLNLRKLQGYLYYHELKRQNVFGIDPSTTSSLPPKELNSSQAAYFFRGCWSLSRYWSNLPDRARNKILHPPTRGFPNPSTRQLQCQAEWEQFWLPESMKKILGDGPSGFGPLESLEKMRATITPRKFAVPSLSCSESFPPEIRVEICPCSHSELSQLISRLRDSLGDHFFGSPSESV